MVPPPGDISGRRRRWSSAGVLLQFAFWLVLAYFCVAFLAPKWESLRLSERLGQLGAGWLLGAGGVLAVQYLYVFALWLLLLRRLGSRPRPVQGFRAYALALLPRYMPGKVLAHGVRAALAMQAGVPGPVAASSLIWESLLGLGSAALAAAFGLILGFSGALGEAARWLIVAFVLGSVLFAAAAGIPLVRARWKHWAGINGIATRPLVIAGFLGLHLGTWVMSGMSHWLLANALALQPLALIFPLTSALATSWGVGVMSVVAPAGLGVREGILYVFIVSVMHDADALLFVTLSRVLAFAVELLLTGAWGLIAVLVVKGPGTADRSPPFPPVGNRPDGQ